MRKVYKNITDKINQGDLSEKPGWVRLSLHPTMTDDELRFIIDAIRQITNHHHEWAEDYIYNKHTNEFRYKNDFTSDVTPDSWFNLQF